MFLNMSFVTVTPSTSLVGTTVEFYVNGKDVHSEWLLGLDKIVIQGGSNTTHYSVPLRLQPRTTINGGRVDNGLFKDYATLKSNTDFADISGTKKVAALNADFRKGEID
jgi:hypothetical protein